jgi:radical SAM enzyme (TIGR01210 family)
VNLPYPVKSGERDEWIIARRPVREPVDPLRPYLYFVEDEVSARGEIGAVATVFLTNRECPWRCVMCDLWRHTVTDTVASGAIPGQIDYALTRLPAARDIKLYNSGSFFDPGAVPPGDYAAIASLVNCFERVIVECHPALVNDDCLRFRDLVAGRLEVAMGLETVHPDILPRLNKRMTLAQFSAAAEFLRRNEIDLRAFILVQPPFMVPAEAAYWACRSLDFAFDCEATAATLIPTRGGNGAMEALAFAPPAIEALVDSVEYGLALARGRVFSDVWDLPDSPMAARLRRMNLTQRPG